MMYSIVEEKIKMMNNIVVSVDVVEGTNKTINTCVNYT